MRVRSADIRLSQRREAGGRPTRRDPFPRASRRPTGHTDGRHRARGPRGREFVLCPETAGKEQSKAISSLDRPFHIRKLENGLGSTPGPEETDRPGDGRTEGRNREEPERVGTLAPTGGGSQAGSGSIGAGGSLGAANQRLGAGYPSIGSGTGRSSKHGLYGHSRGWSAARPSPGSGGARRVAAPAGRPKRSNVPVVAARHPPPPLTLTPPAAPLALPWIAGSSGCPSGWQPSRRGPSTALSAIGLRRAPRGPYRASDRA